MAGKDCTPEELAMGMQAYAFFDGGHISRMSTAKLTGHGYSRSDGYRFTPQQIAYLEGAMFKQDQKFNGLNNDMNLERQAKKGSYSAVETWAENHIEAMEKSMNSNSYKNFGSKVSQLWNASLPHSIKVHRPVFERLHKNLQLFTEVSATLDYKESKDLYDEKIRPIVKDYLARFDRVLDISPLGNSVNAPTKLGASLKFYGFDGMRPSDIPHTLDFLRWLDEGGALFSQRDSGKFNPALKMLDRFSASVVRCNLKWAVSNLAETYRLGVFYNPVELGAGLQKALQASKGQLWAEIPELKRKGVYNQVDFAVTNKSLLDKLDPFQLSLRLQKNLAWYTDKAAGGDGWTGISKTVLDRPWWDMPAMYADHRMKHTLSMTRFLYAETLQTFELFNNVLKNPKVHGMELARYLALRTALFGATSLIPAVVYDVLPDETKEWLKSVTPLAPFGFMGKYVQPVQGLYFGAGLAKTATAANNVLIKAPQGTWLAVTKGKPEDVAMELMTGAGYAGMFLGGVPESFARTIEGFKNMVVKDKGFEEVQEKVLRYE
jgi:hypothetical protein